MEKLNIENFSFSYPAGTEKALKDVTFTVNTGEFITVCGPSGCGKSTLLRNLKPSFSPKGDVCGRILLDGKNINELSQREDSSRIGFILQNPDSQIVTDKVWHELAFGLENMGYKNAEMRARVAEMASFFGISEWFHKKTCELSGGQKQLLNLASVMVMQPELLILDEPTGQLDPIAASEFLSVLSKMNRELGVTVIISEHRLEECFAMSDRVLVLDGGRIIAADTPKKVGAELRKINSDYFKSFPTPMRVYASSDDGNDFPVSVSEGRSWLYEKVRDKKPELAYSETCDDEDAETVIEIKDVSFRYEKNGNDVLSGLNMKVKKGEFYALLGANGVGKTTVLSLITGEQRPADGRVKVKNVRLGAIPQNPEILFLKNTVALDLYDMLLESGLSYEEKERRVSYVAGLCNIERLMDRHPYDLSGGEKQRAALAKVLLLEPELLLLDEPTKGLDNSAKEEFADIIASLTDIGVTALMVSHDIEFCARYAKKCGLLFDGRIVSEEKPREFFAGKSFYTTTANRMSRGILDGAVLAEDIISALGGKEDEKIKEKKDIENITPIKRKETEKTKIPPKRICAGILFAVAAILTFLIFNDKYQDARVCIVYAVELLFSGAAVSFFLPKSRSREVIRTKNKLTKRTIFSVLMVLVAIPLTIFIGIYYFGDKKYFIISMLIILEIMLPFVFAFEKRDGNTGNLVMISILCAIAVVSRNALYMLPMFKPALAIIIISAVAFGGETGFLLGAMYAFVSNFFFGQGPWTPWQMFTYGIIGFLAGILSDRGILWKDRISLSVFGGVSALFIFGGIMNPASVIMYQTSFTADMFISAYIMGLPYDLIHALSTVFFMWFLSEPFLEKISRIKSKYLV